ncbi:MAG TPA: hypothetical protein PLN69_02975 [bacterium]|mgnify:CR=1 FL=1|nr:hypothetical protein [bacterium]
MPYGKTKNHAVALLVLFLFIAVRACAGLLTADWEPYGPAGDVPGMLSVSVTGGNVSRDLFVPLAVKEIRKNASVRNGAKLEIKKRIIAPDYVPAGRSDGILAWVTIKGSGFKTVAGPVLVRINNLEANDLGEADRLYVSNSPELLTCGGILLDGAMRKRESVRYLLHHKNGIEENMNLIFNIANTGNIKAKLVLVEGDPSKGESEMIVGHLPAVEFMKNSRDSVGRIIELEPGSRTAIHRIKLRAGEIISGVGELHMIDGEQVEFEIKALEPSVTEVTRKNNIGNSNSIRGHGVFGKPVVEIEEEFVIGGRWKFIGIGDDPLENLDDGNTALKGNYGVTYHIRVAVINDSGRAEKAQLHFSPVSGPARGTLIVDGELFKLGVCKPPRTRKVKAFWVGPYEKKMIDVMIMPESGSFYPVRLVFMARKI